MVLQVLYSDVVVQSRQCSRQLKVFLHRHMKNLARASGGFFELQELVMVLGGEFVMPFGVGMVLVGLV